MYSRRYEKKSNFDLQVLIKVVLYTYLHLSRKCSIEVKHRSLINGISIRTNNLQNELQY